MFRFKKNQLPTADTALKGRATPLEITAPHTVLGSSLTPPYPDGTEQLMVGLGCFWGAEKCFWNLEGIVTTAVGYSAGYTPNPTYEEVCSGMTGHNEVVLVVYQPEKISVEALLKTFWEAHNPTQGMRQGNDQGTQYRSGIYYFTDEQQQLAENTKHRYQAALEQQKGGGMEITTEIIPASTFYFAEAYHQQYLAKNPNGYCGLGGLGVCL
ncbi:Peptide methionine sulfoxide reductase MsrA [gamma proteobacterium IMCC1989]|nr:Peptide methionine sulfoxide reductase MsrA [gamma proteobacterium IMCC1989]